MPHPPAIGMFKTAARLFTGVMVAAIPHVTTIAHAQDIALSLVNPKGRIDVPVSMLLRVDASPTTAIRNSATGEVKIFPDPYVNVCIGGEFKERICELSRQTINEPLAIVVGCETVAKPIIREPLCNPSCFRISADNYADAMALAARIRTGHGKACLSPSAAPG